ncbi:AraC-like DNA-binding protein [Novosphingobium chloroacetimidivorans]|uniref:AraC-like DNA-binding protein n=1 Tax=Novosphingobium chloroacetimidivorans TaxID=1428314 RepID=A0A7W7K922_9SPHN|nr:helix-turn-helix domain-containing protein [Novosphingobium chloroacetimidivorans]MBB4857803.1 AraC-like DNA-binding protein [Novosphingobium chloroacetimidivorans]
MIRSSRPAVDPRIAPAYGVTRDGQPLSYNRAPSPDLSAWVARLSVAKLHLQPGHTLACGLFADTAGIRIQLAGAFELATLDGVQDHTRGALFCGPHSRLMPVRVRGDFISIGLSLRPSACTALMGPVLPQYVDRVVPTRKWSPEYLLSLFDPAGSPEGWLTSLEDAVRRAIVEHKDAGPEPITARFEEIAFTDPAMSVAQAARELEVDRRRLERLVLRDFGMPPKQVLKRARALDMASHLRGVADGDEGEALALRYYDESHLIREFVELFGMSPRQFTALPQPLLTLTLEARQARRLEMMNRLAPGDKRPWE